MEEKNHNIISKINKLIALAKNYSNIEEIEKLKETIDKKVKKLEYDEFIRNNPIGFNFEVIVEEENSSFPLYHLYLNYALNGNLHRINLSQQLHMTAFLGKDSFFCKCLSL